MSSANTFMFIGGIAGAFATTVGALLLVARAFIRAVESVVGPEFEKLREQHDSLRHGLMRSQGEQDEEFYDEVRSIHGRIDTLVNRVDTVEAHLVPNGGGSLRDVVDRIERHMEHLMRPENG